MKYRLTVYANARICRAVEVTAATFEDARDAAFELAQRDIEQGNIGEWDMTADTEIETLVCDGETV